jgi:cytochrome P450
VPSRQALSFHRLRPSLPLLGDLLRMRARHLEVLDECRDTGADVVELHLGDRRGFVLLHPDAVRAMLVDDSDAFLREGNLETATIRAYLGRGVLTTDGPSWLAWKRMNAPAFARGTVEALQPLVDDSIARSLAAWPLPGSERPLFDELLRLAVTATSTGFLSVRPDESEQDALAAAMLAGPELVFRMARNRATWLRHLPLPQPARVRRAPSSPSATARASASASASRAPSSRPRWPASPAASTSAARRRASRA